MDGAKYRTLRAAAAAWSVVVAASFTGACESQVTRGGDGGGSAGTGGGSAGTGGGSASTSTGTPTGSTTTSSTGLTCQYWCSDSGVCPFPNGITAALDGSTLSISFSNTTYLFCFEDWTAEPTVTVASDLGTLGTVITDGDGGGIITVELATGTTGGTVTVDLPFVMRVSTGCFESEYVTQDCNVTRTFEITFSDAGDPQIAQRGS